MSKYRAENVLGGRGGAGAGLEEEEEEEAVPSVRAKKRGRGGGTPCGGRGYIAGRREAVTVRG